MTEVTEEADEHDPDLEEPEGARTEEEEWYEGGVGQGLIDPYTGIRFGGGAGDR